MQKINSQYYHRRIITLKELNDEVSISVQSVIDQMPKELKLARTAIVLGSGLTDFVKLFKN